MGHLLGVGGTTLLLDLIKATIMSILRSAELDAVDSLWMSRYNDSG